LKKIPELGAASSPDTSPLAAAIVANLAESFEPALLARELHDFGGFDPSNSAIQFPAAALKGHP